MVVETLKIVYDQNREKDSLFLRNLLKEQLQYFVLNFVYNSIYGEKFVFKGGTCLRFCFGLPRLSEDLDFDVEDFKNFSFKNFSSALGLYFKNQLKYKDLKIKISGKNKMIYLQFPVLKEIGFPVEEKRPTENILFLRIDLFGIKGRYFNKEISLKSTYNFSILMRRYALPDLFACKVAAILGRKGPVGKEVRPRIKGRDFFDLFWFKENGVVPNWKFLFSLTGLKTEEIVLARLREKIKEAVRKKQVIKTDLLPFFANPTFVSNFINNLEAISKPCLQLRF